MLDQAYQTELEIAVSFNTYVFISASVEKINKLISVHPGYGRQWEPVRQQKPGA